ncbi:MAG: hypothetical protein CLLPBCKN_002286 [Chroococcidiopsis cubana SAG 39.79]|jgi:hypothetical protein|uniref:Uncharacterized protein n=2 Tax=Chroococcidiopsis TaxID=54298 RepID=K9TUL8_CHRTP|nr:MULTISPECIES: glycine zipper domain-containing protein [Chroococcidiopsis]PSB44340.1 hypothetical protein C7B80_20920 [Cyanosarcina cf. burmensis CCALA 770]AFY85694.1 hypothetical protein Chro_0138 [Chroococcidiopsis thermalis PCC 7203]MDZ4872890.1 hypothetical protein [Chroococcidiopsis cubana SAG 39.79]PSB61690.1 hypothetical protein C7B79_21020 [Chroococcidiopsis cubana CCALA 043]RUT12794.1 hypothetical protein DSM107010_19240 [Chroococcidiopsis cubana SAG 39.79]
MLTFKPWQTGTAFLMALTIGTSATLPMVMTAPATAQVFPSSPGSSRISDRTTIRAGARIPVRYDEAEKIVISPKERMRLTLTVAANITNRNGTVLVPAGSLIEGELVPADGGSQFIARNLIIDDGRRQSIDASSDVIETTQLRRGVSTGSILKGAVVGAAAGAALGGLTGNRRISTGEVLIGTGVGAAGGAVLGRKKADVVVINPDTDLDLILDSSLTVDRY